MPSKPKVPNTVEGLIWRLSKAMKRGCGRVISLRKRKDGSVLCRTTADRGKDVRDFWKEMA